MNDAPAALQAGPGHQGIKSMDIVQDPELARKLAPDLSEARRLFGLGLKLCKLEPYTKQPVGERWNERPVTRIEQDATGYGVLLALNGLCSIDPDNVEPARIAFDAVGFDLDEIMDSGARTRSSRPGSGGRSTFKAKSNLGWVKLAVPGLGTVFELRAHSANLQDVLPGVLYRDKAGNLCTQAYANHRRIDEAPELPKDFAKWWARCASNVEFWRSQQRLMSHALGVPVQLAISAAEGGDKQLAFASACRHGFNEHHQVVDILERHGYQDHGGDRWSPQTASGKPGVRPVPGKDDLWQSDHASDPLHGTFDAWTAHVVLDHDGDVQAAERAWLAERDAQLADDFDVIDRSAQQSAQQPDLNELPELDWLAMPEEPAEVPFVIPGWMPDGVVTLLAAHGGTGKSYLSLFIALCLATGRHPFTGGAAERVKVLLYSAEDNMTVMQARLARYMRLLGLDRADLVGWLFVLDATESENVLFVGSERTVGKTTRRYDWLAEKVKATGARVLIFDNASDALDASENDRAKVRQFMSALKRLASAVLLLAHVDAATSMVDPSLAKGYSGSTAWHNSARSRWFMARRGESEDIVLSLPKVNYGKAGGEAVIRWSDSHGVFEVVSAREGRLRAGEHRELLLGLLQQAVDSGRNVSPSKQSPTSVYNVIKEARAFPSGLTSAAMQKEVDLWLAEGLVALEEYRASNREVRQRIVLTSAGLALCRGGEDAPEF